MLNKPVWISCADQNRDAAVYLRKEFVWEQNDCNAVNLRICGLGYYELYINGKRVGDRELDPVVSHYDISVRYVDYEIRSYLKPGKNCIGVILGNGWYNPQTVTAWNTENCSWRQQCRLYLDVQQGEKRILVSGPDWKVSNKGPIIFTSLRNGESYDARLEFGVWTECGFDDSAWQDAFQINPPGGNMEPMTQPPCRVTRKIKPIEVIPEKNGRLLADFGVALTGRVRFTAKGEKDAELIMVYGEEVAEDSSLDISKLCGLIRTGEFQTEHYWFKGDSISETWASRFTYHGFRYVEITCNGNIDIQDLTAEFIHTDFPVAGEFKSSSEMLNKLQACTLQSYLDNFTGIPTDCPHREKNGWTGDANLAAETGLYNYDAFSAYAQWIDTFADEQRPSGQVPCVVPTGTFGYIAGWGGPAWDSAFIMIPWNMYRFTGDDSVIRKHYHRFKKLLAYFDDMSQNHIIIFGLGDWCPPAGHQMVDNKLTSTAFYYGDVLILAQMAKILGLTDDQNYYTNLAAEIKKSFNETFYRGNGIYDNGNITACSAVLYFGLQPDAEIEKLVLDRLIHLMEEKQCKADFGILGAKFTAHVLGERNYSNLLYQLFVQEEYPGWASMVKRGATSLWETWNPDNSRIHIMYGDISACFYKFFAGLRIDDEQPGFRHTVVQPLIPDGLDSVCATHETRWGRIQSAWQKEKNEIVFHGEIPQGITAELILPDQTVITLNAGKYNYRYSC